MAESLREILEEIRVRRGALTAEAVVEEASAKSHPLHHRFEWSDAEAAKKYRLGQATELIRSVSVQFVKDDKPMTVRAYQAVRRDGSYDRIEEVARDPVARTVLLHQAEREWKSMFQRYAHLEEFLLMAGEDIESVLPGLISLGGG